MLTGLRIASREEIHLIEARSLALPRTNKAVAKLAHDIVANNAHSRTQSTAAMTRPPGQPNIWIALSQPR